ncbi:hypothetical protein [Shinella zoogloeoides]|uniref:hypothetical protein n=1 Tax=Shinella zoogloeoides TaxID=352475 RepID=UPI0028A6EB95|nr:hypothetical protein [Shinella zoogloeoides]
MRRSLWPGRRSIRRGGPIVQGKKPPSVGRLTGALGGLSGDNRRQLRAGLFQFRFDLGALGRIAVVGLAAQFFDVVFEGVRHRRHLLVDVKDDGVGHDGMVRVKTRFSGSRVGEPIFLSSRFSGSAEKLGVPRGFDARRSVMADLAF